MLQGSVQNPYQRQHAIICPSCSVKLSQKGEALKHLMGHPELSDNDAWKVCFHHCNFCNFFTIQRSNLKGHIQRKHRSRGPALSIISAPRVEASFVVYPSGNIFPHRLIEPLPLPAMHAIPTTPDNVTPAHNPISILQSIDVIPYVGTSYVYPSTTSDTMFNLLRGVPYIPELSPAGTSTQGNLWNGQRLPECYSEHGTPDVVFDVSDHNITQAIHPQQLLSRPIELDVYNLNPNLCQVNLPFLGLDDEAPESDGFFGLGTSRPSPP